MNVFVADYRCLNRNAIVVMPKRAKIDILPLVLDALQSPCPTVTDKPRFLSKMRVFCKS